MNNPSTTNDIPLLTAPFLHYIPTSPPSQELDFHLPSRTPLHGLTVSEWAGSKSTRYQLQNDTIHSTLTNTTTTPPTSTTTNIGTTSSVHITNTTTNSKPIVLKDSNEDNWRDVYRNIKCMDQLYDASFYSWLKSEENVLVTAMYLHRIANEYPLVRIINALKWLISDWRLESISTLVKHVTVDWCDEAGDLRRAHLLRHLTHSWATQYTTTLITMVLSSAPYATTSSFQRERFLREFTKEWDFSKLSEFFMYLQSPANIDYKVKCVMLQEAARRERETLGAKLKKKRVQQHDLMDHSSTTHNTTTTMNSSTTTTNTAIVSPSLHTSLVEDTTTDSTEEAATSRRHHRRTSSNDVNDIKRLRLSTPDLIDHSTTTTESSNSGLCEPLSTQPSQLDLSSSSSPLSSSSSSSSSMSSELSHLHLDLNGSNTNSCTNHHHHHHHHHTPSSSQDIQLRRRTSSNASLEDPMDMDYNSRKRTSGPSSSSYFTTTTDEAL
ncbi:hypothetical protein A0J61_02908 [Choanephora cucurbitarum]|uniref:Uncharacterized protein n=1 Tax=Choanephora cucurbitarum TaxID=101091 RepID=A0A1C7NIR8_9FUNG|nr:hypothetical protein A0J61_02908 [Choanephora cucurbitarum]